MDKTRSENKKRKVLSSVPVKAEDGSALAPPPDPPNLSPIQKILLVDLWKDDSKIVKSALTKLATLCKKSSNEEFEENRATVNRLGGAAILATALRKWYGFPVIQAEGCRALMGASCDEGAFKKSVKDSGGLHAIIWAMKSYPDNLKVQTSACGALGNGIYGVKENAEYVVNTLNGIDWIIAAMNKFPHDAALQFVACSVLDNLVKWDEFRDPVMQAGGRRALLDAIENHKDESKDNVEILQKKASSALKKVLP